MVTVFGALDPAFDGGAAVLLELLEQAAAANANRQHATGSRYRRIGGLLGRVGVLRNRARSQTGVRMSRDRRFRW
jgi:hypothetical protein